MRVRRVFAGAAAGLGAAALVVLPFAGRAPADTAPQTLPIYALNGVGSGVEVQLAPKPEVLDPLVDVGLMHVATSANAAGGGASNGLAADIFPGAVVIGGAGCSNQKYLQMFGIQQSAYPSSGCKYVTRSGETAPMQFPPGGTGPVVLDAGHVKTTSDAAHSHATAVLNHFTLAPSTSLSIVVDHMTVTSDSLANATTATQTVTVSTSGMHLTTPAFGLDITNMVSKAVSTTDGTTGTTDTTFTIGDATVTIAGASHRVTIDNMGVHLEDLNAPSAPGVTAPGDVRQPLSYQLQQAIAQAGIIIRTGTPNEITNGANAESSIGGLLISFESGRPPAIPITVPIQQPVPWPSPPSIPGAPIAIGSPQGWPVPQFPPICQFPPPIPNIGLCVGQGIVPLPPGDVLASVSIGGADAMAAAAGTLPGTCSTCGTTGGLFGGGTTGGPISTSVGGTQTTGGGGIGTPPNGGTGIGRLYGLVAKLPSAALAGAGAALLVLAVGLAAGPSLRA